MRNRFTYVITLKISEDAKTKRKLKRGDLEEILADYTHFHGEACLESDEKELQAVIDKAVDFEVFGDDSEVRVVAAYERRGTWVPSIEKFTTSLYGILRVVYGYKSIEIDIIIYFTYEFARLVVTQIHPKAAEDSSEWDKTLRYIEDYMSHSFKPYIHTYSFLDIRRRKSRFYECKFNFDISLMCDRYSKPIAPDSFRDAGDIESLIFDDFAILLSKIHKFIKENEYHDIKAELTIFSNGEEEESGKEEG